MRPFPFLFAATIMIAVSVFSQQEIMVVMKPRTGYGPFLPGRVLTTSLGKKPDIKEFPADVIEYVIREIDCQPYNTEYKNMLGYGMTKDEFLRGYKDVSADLLSGDNYHHRFFILLGKNQKNEIVVIVDTNQNLSFNDDQVFTFPVLNTIEKQKKALDSLPSVTIPFEYYNGRYIIKLPTRIELDPYKGSLKYTLADSIENKYFLSLRIPGHKTGIFILNKQQYEIFLTNYSTGIEYTLKRAALLAATPGTPRPESKDNPSYAVSDVFSLNGNLFRFTSVSRLGDTVRLAYMGINKRNEGFAEGYNIPGLQANTVTGEKFQLSALQGKYVLLDFWGTWCQPCIQSIPRLKTLHDKYKEKNFVLVSVANDNNLDKLKNFVRENKMDWLQLYQNEHSKSNETELLKSLKISEYPTTILIDPEGKIVLRGKDIEDIDSFLAKTLK